MKLTRFLSAAAVAASLVLGSHAASAAGMWFDWPGIGYGSYCASNSTGVTLPTAQGPYGIVPGSTAGTGNSICAQTVPAGPTTFSGNEYVPADLGPLGGSTNSSPSSSVVQLVQLGQGPMIDLTTVATSQTIPNNTPYYFLDGSQGSALTVTMPAVAIEGQIQRVICEAATVGTLTVAANTNQTLKGNPNAACTANVGYAWRYQASNTTWYRVN